MNTNQGFTFTGSDTYNFDNVTNNPVGIALYDAITGYGGIDYMPYDGSTVIVKATAYSSLEDVTPLSTSLNNKVYYLVTDQLYTDQDRDTIISLATSISLTVNTYLQDDVLDNLLDDLDDPLIGTSTGSVDGDIYVGTFVFSNPNDYEYIYLLWDYTNTMDGGTASYDGGLSTKYIDVDFGTDIGNAGITHTLTGTPARFVLNWNGAIMADTGYIGLNSQANYDALIAAGVSADAINLTVPLDGLVDNGTGTIAFNKFITDGLAQLTVYSPLASTSWSLLQVDPTLTSFYIDTAEGTLDAVCSQVADELYYHDGAGTTPTVGDRIYSDTTGATTFNGTNTYHLVSATLQVVPPVTGGIFVGVDADGLCYAFGECDCAEVAAPVIDQDPINLTQGRPVNLIISATNNPTSWTVDSTCIGYTLNGGTKGSIFSVTDCNSITKNVTVNYETDVYVCASAVPTLSFGDGTINTETACLSFILPRGLSFDTVTGILSGTPAESCEYSFDLTATNCFGTSATGTIDISIETGIKLTPFAIDVENVSADGTTACAIMAVYTLMYHNGIGDVPALNDTIYMGHQGYTPFMGGSRWYNVDNSAISIKICETGKVCETHTC